MQKTAFDSGRALAFSQCPPKQYRGLTKTLLVMKLTIVFSALVFFQVHASNGLAQTVTISGKDLTLKQVFAAVAKQTGYAYFNTKGTFDGAKPVTLTVHNMPLTEFLDLVLKGQDLEYEIKGKTIALVRKAEKMATRSVPSVLKLFDEKEPITGIVLNDDGVRMSGVSIFLKKSNKGTFSNALGAFSIQADIGDTLQFSYVGYADQIVKVNKTNLIINMKVAHSIMDETQITAYGKTSRKLATGNITTIKAADIEKQPIFNAMEALAGRVPGISIQPQSGNLAAPVAIVIRGRNSITPGMNNDPLYVIDGLPLSNINISMFAHANNSTSLGSVQAGMTHMRGENPLNRINPLDIESITVLKDADATAIYGSRGANGVILITTKKGKAGPPAFQVQLNNGITSPQKFLKVMNTKEYLAVRREALQNDGLIPDNTNAPDLVAWDSTRNKDWQRELYGTGIMNNLYASVSGGSGQTSFNVSANHRTITTLLNAGGKNRQLAFNSSLNYTSSNQKLNFRLGSMLSSGEVVDVALASPTSLPPNAPEFFTEDGAFNWEPYRRPVYTEHYFAKLKKPSESKTFEVQSNLGLNYKILDNLSIDVSGVYAFAMNDNIMKDPEASYDPVFFTFSRATYGSTRLKNWLLKTEIRYETFIGKGALTAQLLSEYNVTTTKGETVIAMGFPNDDLMKSYNNAMPGGILNLDSYLENKFLKFTGIVHYNWDNKYIFNITGTRDGSPHFGKRKQFGNFGSAGFAWNLNEEKWLKHRLPDWVNLLKLRGSLGITGSSQIQPYEYLSRWSKATFEGSFETLFPYNGTQGFHVIKPLNQEFHWVNQKMAELGLELSLFDSRLNFSTSVYNNVSTDQLSTIPIARITGFSQAFTNTNAHLRNRGVEIAVSGSPLRTKEWNLTLNFNIGWNRNKLTDFPDLEYSSNKDNLKIGYSTTTVYVLRYTGIDPLTGTYTFEDHNKDGRVFAGSNSFPSVDYDDRYIAIETADKYTGGFGFVLSYKQLSLSGIFDFADRLRQDPYLSAAFGTMNNIVLPKDVLDNHWRKPGDLAKYPKFTTGANPGVLGTSTAAYISGAYLRMNGLALSWNLPASWIKKVKLKGASLAIQSNNLFTFSSFPGLDPQINYLNSATPIPRVISSNLSIHF